MKAFLDVGAHVGETLRAVRDPRYRFDRIVCFEPATKCLARLSALSDPRVTIAPFGLWNETCERPLYDPGAVGASLFADKGRSAVTQTARLVRASDWFASNLRTQDRVYVKLNCEGAECDILEDLLDSGEIRKVDQMLIHFDVRKVPSQRHREEEVKARLRGAGIRNYAEADDMLIGPSHVARIHRWLQAAGADEYSKLGAGQRIRSRLGQLRFVVAPAAIQRSRLGRLGRRVLPGRLYARLQASIYPEAGSDQ